MRLAIPSCIALTLMSFSGLYLNRYLRFSREEEISRQFEAACHRIEEVPNAFGDWAAADRSPENELLFVRGVVSSRTSAYFVREYRHLRSGEKVLLVLLSGKSKRISIHTPEDVYSCTGIALLRRPEPIEVLTKQDSAFFRTAPTELSDCGNKQSRFQAFWAWNEGGMWEAPEYPRLTFANEEEPLYKMYVYYPINDDDNASLDDTHPAISFMQAAIPAIGPLLFPESELSLR